MSDRRVTVADLRPIDLFDDLDDDAARRVGRRRAACARSPRASSLAEQGDEAAGPAAACSRARRRRCIVDGGRIEPVGPPARADVDRARSPSLTGGAARRAHARRDRLPRSRSSRADDFRRLALAQPAVHRRVMQQVAPVMSRLTGDRAEPRAPRRRSGTMAAGLAHELNNPAAAASARRGRAWPRRSRSSARRSARFVEPGVERERGRRARRAAARGARARPRRARRSTRSTPPTPRTSCSTRLEDLGVARAVAARRAARRRGRRRRTGSSACAALAGPATDAALRWVAASLTARGLAAELQESTRADVRPRRRGQDLRLHGPRRASSRSTCTRASRRRSSSSATSSSTRRSRSCATTTARCRS